MVHDWNNMSLDDLFTHIEQDEQGALQTLIKSAKHEDLRTAGDITSKALVPEHQQATARVVARRSGRLAGLALLPHLIMHYDEAIDTTETLRDGDTLEPGSEIVQLAGPLCSILALERVLLNFLSHLSGIATQTARYVDAVAGTRAKIYDTRKTIPGLRKLAKYAVRCGGGFCHRIGLYDAILVKDNHIAHIPPDELADQLSAAISKARHQSAPPHFVEVEVDTMDQLNTVLPLDIDIVLLDNMPADQMHQAVELRDRINAKVQLEASGGVTLGSVPDIARTGIDRIAVGALTHSVPALDIGLDIV